MCGSDEPEVKATAKKLSKKTINLLRKIERHILAEPRRLNMKRWGTVYDLSKFAKLKKLIQGNATYIPGVQEDVAKNMPPCGTVGCIAGWTVFLSKPKIVDVLAAKAADSTVDTTTQDGEAYVRVGQEQLSGDAIYSAQDILGLEPDQAKRLFYFSNMVSNMHGYYHWPLKFEDAYRNAKTPRARAKVTVERIEHFIKTNGAE